MAQHKTKRKKKKARQGQKTKPATPAQTEITNPEEVKTETQKQTVKSTESPLRDVPQKRMNLAEKLSLLILFGLLCANYLTLWTMRENAKQEKRAWIGVVIPALQSIKVGEKLSYQVTFSNTGKTPSIGTKIFSKMVFDQSDSDILAFFEKDIPSAPNIGEIPLMPNAKIGTSDVSKAELTESILHQIKSGKTTIFVLVKVEYRDIFGESHKTHACLKYGPKLQKLIAYHKYNYMD